MTTDSKTPKSRSRKKAPTIPTIARTEKPDQVWFSRTGCAVRKDGRVEVFVDGSLLGSYEEKGETDIRNVLLVMLAQKGAVVLEKLAEAFGLTSEGLRLIRKQYESEGLEAVIKRRRGGNYRKSKVTSALRRRMEALFEQGLSVSEVHERLRGKLSRASVGNVRKRWAAAKAARAVEPQQQVLGCVAPRPDGSEPQEEAADPTPKVEVEPSPERGEAQATEQDGSTASVARAPEATPQGTRVAGETSGQGTEGSAQATSEREPELEGVQFSAIRAPRDESPREARIVSPDGDEDEKSGPEDYRPVSRRAVQALGSWLLVAMVARRGFYERAQDLLAEGLRWCKVRIAIDATLIALATRQKCVEGVRRLATSGAAALLIATGAPSPGWTRRTLGLYCRDGVSRNLHSGQAGDLIREAWSRREEGRPVPFFADNHARPYTGQHRVMWHWRMQDKRSRPGACDYYIHDRSGRPVFRFTANQGSLPQFLSPIATILKLALDEGTRILLGFDRGGAFPEIMAAMRAAKGVEFVTYERAPYRKLSRQRFEKEGERIEVDGERPEETQTILVLEDQCNLGKGRGRLRRLRLLMPDGHQVNVLTNSKEDAAWLVRTLFGRWCQENGFKYGVERWGINQLDGRVVEAFDPETIIANPKKRRLKRELDDLREREGTLRRKLARSENDAAEAQERARLEEQLARLLPALERLEARHRRQPDHVTVRQAGLDGKLVHHRTEYKMLIDTLRVAGANAESELASHLAPHLARPREAKRALQNLFGAAGDIRVGNKSITITLDPAGTRNEREAFAKLLATANRWKLRHPGDPMRRPLRFRVQNG